MKSTKIRAIAGATVLFLANEANAASYSNLSGETPFDLTLDTGSAAWVNPTSNLNSSSTTTMGDYIATSTVTVGPVIVLPGPGVEGYVDVYEDTSSTPMHYVSENQSLSISYSAGLAAPIDVPTTYIMSGTIEKQTGATLLSGGSTSLNFSMGMNIDFVDPYTLGTADGTLTFRVGSTPGIWAYVFTTNFNTDPGYVSLSNSQYLDLNNPIFFESEYTIDGTPGIQFGVDSLTLGISGGLGSYTENATGSTTTVRETVSHTVLPAYPVAVPVPSAAWLLGSGLIGIVTIARRHKAA